MKADKASVEETHVEDDESEDYEVVLAEDMEKDGPDSPWTIEAIDGDSDEVCISIKRIIDNIISRKAHRVSIDFPSSAQSPIYSRGKWWGRNSVPTEFQHS